MATNSSGLQKITDATTLTPSGSQAINVATNANKIFGGANHYTSANVKSALVARANKTLEDICEACKSQGVTWEGVWDGDSCIALAKLSATAKRTETCLASI